MPRTNLVIVCLSDITTMPALLSSRTRTFLFKFQTILKHFICFVLKIDLYFCVYNIAILLNTTTRVVASPRSSITSAKENCIHFSYKRLQMSVKILVELVHLIVMITIILNVTLLIGTIKVK